MVDFGEDATKLEQEGEQKAEADVKKRFGGNKQNNQKQGQQPNQTSNQQ